MTEPEKKPRPGQIILSWWSTELGDRSLGAQKTLSARLRRGDDLTVLCQEKVHELAQRLNLHDGKKIARLARILAHVREHSGASLPRLLGTGDPRVMSALRFERLVHSDDQELETVLRRALGMVKFRANVAELGEAVLFWTANRRTRWCFDYYGADAPDSLPAEDTDQ